MQSTIVHIQEAARELAQMADREGLAFLGYLLRMAAQEADEMYGRVSEPVPRSGQLEDCLQG